MTLSRLTPLQSPYHPHPQAQRQLPIAAPAYDVHADDIKPKPTPVVPVQPRVEHRDTSVVDAHVLSIETINLLVKENPALVARMVIDAGRRRRAELQTPMGSLKPMARFILLAGMNRRAEKLSEADAMFLEDFPKEFSEV